jgi:hypothetical protein
MSSAPSAPRSKVVPLQPRPSNQGRSVGSAVSKTMASVDPVPGAETDDASGFGAPNGFGDRNASEPLPGESRWFLGTVAHIARSSGALTETDWPGDPGCRSALQMAVAPQG